MLNQKQFGCFKFLPVNFNYTQVCKGETPKKTTIHNLKLNFPPDKWHPGHRSGYGFLRTACQPIRIENFEKPYNKIVYYEELLIRNKATSHDIMVDIICQSAYDKTVFCSYPWAKMRLHRSVWGTQAPYNKFIIRNVFLFSWHCISIKFYSF